MAFLMSRSTSKHVFLALGVDLTARDAVKAGVLTLVSRKLYLLQCRARLVSVHVPSLHLVSSCQALGSSVDSYYMGCFCGVLIIVISPGVMKFSTHKIFHILLLLR